MWHDGYTIILLGCAILVGYELFAACTQLFQNVTRWPTISESVWRLTRRFPWLKWVGTAAGVVLILHFWWGLW